eukprot:gnl/Chilomastix_cuspidata/359.p1 GENE.gnl/Chilomastix_cuspidata/359~~gnl/Chilomastix_cuspidata/359.p1  ORF type:complete len:720 (-),score=333.19 gnl/Chilomastix_cuspidata/359:856-3015(-)
MPEKTTNRKGKLGHRTLSTERRLKMYSRRAKRDSKGRIIRQEFHNTKPTTDGRIASNRKWFGNTRVVGQKELATFREAIEKTESNPNVFLLRSKHLPMDLLQDNFKQKKVHLTDTSSFATTFGPKATRKHMSAPPGSLEALVSGARERHERYNEADDHATAESIRARALEAKDMRTPHLERAQTARVYAELYKVIDSSDVVVQVLDARDPLGTRSTAIEGYMRRDENKHKHLIFVLNKIDLVPISVTRGWLRFFSRIRPTIAFHASKTRPFGRRALIGLLRQFARLHKDRKQISVGFAGYPNVGKSLIINSLVDSASCSVAPIPGETKIWQYVTLTKRIYLIDCPGVVYPGKDTTETDLVLRGVIRPENLSNWSLYAARIIERTPKLYLDRTYGLDAAKDPRFAWHDADSLLEAIAFRLGRIVKGGEADTNAAGRRLIEDWIRGRIPFFTQPPSEPAAERAEPATADGAEEPLDLPAFELQLLQRNLVNPMFAGLPGFAEGADAGADAQSEELSASSAPEGEDEAAEEPTPPPRALGISELHMANSVDAPLLYYDAQEDSASDVPDAPDAAGAEEDVDWAAVFGAPGAGPAAAQDAAPDAEAAAAEAMRARDVKLDNFIVEKSRRRTRKTAKRIVAQQGKRADGARRHARVNREMPRDIARFAGSPYLSADDLRMVLPQKKRRAPKRDRGGAKGKIGRFVHAEQRERVRLLREMQRGHR